MSSPIRLQPYSPTPRAAWGPCHHVHLSSLPLCLGASHMSPLDTRGSPPDLPPRQAGAGGFITSKLFRGVTATWELFFL